MELYYQVYGEGEPLVIVHGLFGSSDNWNALSKQFGIDHKVYALDVRNHGKSPHANEMDYDLMSADLLEFLDQHQLDQVNLIGHSMGGKLAMTFANQYPERINNLVLVDIGPQLYPPHHGEKIAALKSLDLSELNSRSEADERIKEEIPDVMVRNFLLKNLYRNEEKLFEWRFNLDALGNNLENIFAEVKIDKQFTKPALFLKGGKSEYIDLSKMGLIEEHYKDYRILTFEESGHWIHAQEPKRLIETVNQFFRGELSS